MKKICVAASGGQYLGFNTPSSFNGDLLKFQVGNNTRVRMTQYGDIIINSGTVTTNALAGTVPVKVSAENGAIKGGDLLVTSNTPGHVMKCTQDCKEQIVANHLESLRVEQELLKP